MTVDELLSEHTPEVAATARRLLEVMVDLLPDAEVRVYPGWHGIGLVTKTTGYLGGIFPRSDDVQLGFERGRLLSDPDGLLEHRGTQMAWLRYQAPSDIDVEPIEGFLHQLGAL